MQDGRGEALLFAQQSEKQMFGTDVFVIKPLGLLGAIGEHPLALMAQREVDGSRHLFPQRGVGFDLFSDRFHRRAGAEKAVGKRFVLPQQPQQQMFGFNAWTAELAGLVTGEENHPPRSLGITFKHDSCSRLKKRQKKDRMKARLESACRAKFKLCVTWCEVRCR